jgi:tetratricopeptide (TPR) repeat protein
LLLPIVLLAASLVGSAQADAPSAEDLARRHHDRGTTFYNLGQFEEAIGEYRKGYEQKADPVFLYNIAQAYRQLGQLDKALFFYRRYLSTAPVGPNRPQVVERIGALEQLIDAQERARSPAPPEPLSGTVAAAPAALPPSLSAPPPRPPDSALASGAAPPPARPPLWHRWWFWAGIGTLVAGGLAVGLIVSSAKSSQSPATDLGTTRFF